MSVAACVTELLCELGAAGVEAVKTVLNAQIAFVTGELQVVRATLLQYDILLLPVVAAKQIATGVLGKIEGYAALVPPELAADCLDIGAISINLARVIEPIDDEVRAVLDKTARYLSFKDELEDLERVLEGTIQSFQDIIDALEACPPS